MNIVIGVVIGLVAVIAIVNLIPGKPKQMNSRLGNESATYSDQSGSGILM